MKDQQSSRNGEENTGPANQTPKCAEIQRYLAGKYPPGVEYDKLAYYMEAAECYGQLAREMELEASGTLTRSETGPSDPSFSYRGLAYARPIGRGVVLEELDGQPHLEDVLPEGDYDIEIKAFRRLSERG